MSAMPSDEPAQDTPSTIDTQQLQQLQQQQDVQLGQQQIQAPPQQDPPRKPKAPSVRRACVACHTGKTRCSEVLPCQSCLKRGLGSTCAYPDPDAQDHQPHHNSSTSVTSVQFAAPPPIYAPNLHGAPALSQQYYDYNGTFTGASSSTFRPNKRQRTLTEEEAAAITRNFSRGDFFVGSSQPVRIDPRLTVRLALGEGDNVHFYVGEPLI